MILYLIKSGLCLLALLGIYLVLLEREKMHHFNRFFLLFSLVFGLTVPLMTIDFQLNNTYQATKDVINVSTDYFTQSFGQGIRSDKNTTKLDSEQIALSLNGIGLFLYGLVVFILAIRFISSLFSILRCVKRSTCISNNKKVLVLVDGSIVPHSFLKYIFVERSLFEKGHIKNEILSHEFIHSKQWHSLDVLLIEILKIIFWFNPVFYFYKKAIQLNHEFLADDAVIQSSSNTNKYRKLLVEYSSRQKALSLASNLNYSLTKKRIVMMTKTTTRNQIWLRKLCTIPILLVLVVFFSANANAQTVKNASVTELVTELTQKIKSGNSLSEAEKRQLGTLFMDLRNVIPPPPPVPLKPVSATEISHEELIPVLRDALRELRLTSSKYMKMTFEKNSEKEIKEAYEVVLATHKEFYELQKKTFNGDKMPPPPPLPPSPDMRKGNNKF